MGKLWSLSSNTKKNEIFLQQERFYSPSCLIIDTIKGKHMDSGGSLQGARRMMAMVIMGQDE
jgi:hypothetical protein